MELAVPDKSPKLQRKIPRPREAKNFRRVLPARVCLIPNPCSKPSLVLFTPRRNSLFEFVSEHRLNCPGELLLKARGESLFKDENTMVRGVWRPAPQTLGSSCGCSGFVRGCTPFFPVVAFSGWLCSFGNMRLFV